MKRVVSTFLIVIMLVSVALAAGTIFAWYRENAASTAEIEDIVTINKQVNVTMKIQDEIPKNADGTNKQTTSLPARGFYPIMPKQMNKFLYEKENAAWLVGVTNGVGEVTKKDVGSSNTDITPIGNGNRRFSQMDNLVIEPNVEADRVFYPSIEVADDAASSGLSCALFAVDITDEQTSTGTGAGTSAQTSAQTSAETSAGTSAGTSAETGSQSAKQTITKGTTGYELIAYTDYNYGYSALSNRSSHATEQANPFVVAENRKIKLTLLTWLDATKANSINIYQNGSVTVDIRDYDNYIVDRDGGFYKEFYTAGLGYDASEDSGAIGEIDTGLNRFKVGCAVDVTNVTEHEHDEAAGHTGAQILRIPNYYFDPNGSAYPITSLKGTVGNVRKLDIPQSVKTKLTKTFFESCESTLEEVILDGSCDIDSETFGVGNNTSNEFPKLKRVYIGPKIGNIGANAFRSCKAIEEITVEGGKEIGSYALGGTEFEEISLPTTMVFSGNSNLFNGNKDLRHVFIDTPIVGKQLLYGCAGLESIVFGPNVTYIPAQVTEGCKNLKSIIIGDNVTKVGDGGEPFAGCNAVTDIVVGKNVTSIYVSSSISFKDMNDSLKNVTVPGHAAKLVMGGKTAVENLTITTGDVPAEAFSGKISSKKYPGTDSIKTVTIQSGVTSIGANAFAGCDNITRLNVPDLASWCGIAFTDANSNPLSRAGTEATSALACKLYVDNKEVTDLVIPEGITEIKNYAFNNCDQLTSVTIPQTVTTIGTNAFTNCGGITKLVAPTSAIGKVPFTNLTSLEITDTIEKGAVKPTTITDIKALTAANLTTLKITGSQVSLDTNQDFKGFTGIKTAVVPANCLALPDSVENLTVLNGGNIPENACQNFGSLTTLRIEDYMVGDKQRTIGAGAFSGCSRLANLAITADDIGNFTSTSGITSLEFIDTLSYKVDKKDESGSTVTDDQGNPVKVVGVKEADAAAINEFTDLEIIQTGDYTTIKGTIDTTKLTKLRTAKVSGSGIGDVLRATNKTEEGQSVSTIQHLHVVSGTITQKDNQKGVLVTGLSFWNWDSTKGDATLTIDDGVIVEDMAFEGCKTAVKTATIPANAINPMLNNINYVSTAEESRAYTQSRDSLTSITVTSGNIPQAAFAQCLNITSVIVEDGVTGIGKFAFGTSNKENDPNNSNNPKDPDLARLNLDSTKIPQHMTYKEFGGVRYLGYGNTSDDNDIRNYYIAVGVTATTATTVNIHAGCKYIAENAFAHLNDLTTVDIPSDVRVTANAFEGSVNIVTMRAPASAFAAINRKADEVTITVTNEKGEQEQQTSIVEYNDKLQTIEVRGGSVARGAFMNFRELKTVTLQDKTIVNGVVFQNCTKLEELTVNGEDVVVADSAFNGCTNIRKIKLPAHLIVDIPKEALLDVTVTSGTIPEYAFANVGMVKLTIGPGVKGVQYNAFANCHNVAELYKPTSFTSAYLPGRTETNEYTISTKQSETEAAAETAAAIEAALAKTKVVIGNDGAVIYDGTRIMRFIGNANNFYEIPSTITAIHKYAFYNRDKVDVDFSGAAALKEIGEYAFYGCESIGTLNLSNCPAGLTTISPYAFYRCTAASSVTLPSSVTTIGERAFYGCGRLMNVTAPGLTLKKGLPADYPTGQPGNGYIAAYAERVIDATTSDNETLINTTTNGDYVTYETQEWQVDSVNTTDTEAPTVTTILGYYGDAEEFTIPAGITKIGDYAFYNRKNLKTIHIPPTVKYIGNYAFVGCTALENIDFMDYVGDSAQSPQLVNIGVRAFHGCTSLKGVEFPASLRSIARGAFDSCTSLKTLAFADGLETIGSRAFMRSSIETLTIPGSVKVIGHAVFFECKKLETVTIEGGHLDGAAVVDQEKMDEIDISSKNDIPYYGATADNKKPKAPGMGKGIFFGCSSLKAVTFGPNFKFTYIPKSTFDDCINLTEIIIPKTITEIQSYAFDGCLRLETVTFQEGWPAVANTKLKIGVGAFHNCKDLERLDLPETSEIQMAAFTGCVKLAAVTVPKDTDKPTIGDYVFMTTRIREEVGVTFRDEAYVTPTTNTIGMYAFRAFKAKGLTARTKEGA